MVRQRSRGQAEVKKSEAERRKEIIDMFYCHCRYCGFWMERRYAGDDVCTGPTCEKRKEDEDIY